MVSLESKRKKERTCPLESDMQAISYNQVEVRPNR